MAMTPACGGNPLTRWCPAGRPASAFILRHNWAIWPPGRGSRCCRILRRRTP